MKNMPLLLLLVACGSEPGTQPADVMPDASPDTLVQTCGNGAVDVGEVCEPGVTEDCTALGSTWTAGSATCRSDCKSWDVSACVRVDSSNWETVEPATRGPWTTARCNDGTPFDFDIRLAAQPTNTWVIQLDGGGFCDEEAKPCSERDAMYKTTSPKTDRQLTTPVGGGIASRNATVNPMFATANHVNATYCSSDFWAGATTDRRPTSGDPVNGWYFSGHTNVAAMLEVLRQRYGLDDTNADTQVLFAGSSAGALGAHFNIAQVEGALPTTKTHGHLRLFVDAGWFTDWVDPDPAPPSYFIGVSTVADAELWKRARALWGATFDPECEAANTEPSRCVFGAVWYPHVSARLPTLIQQSSMDAQFAVNHGIDVATANPTRDAWQHLVESSQLGVSWLFSGDTSYHTLSTTNNGLLTEPAGSKLRDLLGKFWTDATPERVEF